MTIRPDPAEFLYAEHGAVSPERCATMLDAFLTGFGNPAREIDRLLEENPASAFGHCLRIALAVRADNIDARARVLQGIATIETVCPAPSHLARRHACAARAWLDGDQALALDRYGAIVVDFPRDIVALAVAHALDFRLGLRRMLRDRIAQVLSDWHDEMPCYASVLAMYAFGLEEDGQYRRAEKIARRALELDPQHPGAVHVIAHVMEMQGRWREGLEFLTATERGWRDTSFAVHLAWHRALFHLEAGDAPSALAVYDAAIARSSSMSELADASALLWRLQLGNVWVGRRWSQLADAWEHHALAGTRTFFTAHAVMAFACARRTCALQRIFDQLRAEHGEDPNSDDALALPLCAALSAFARGDFAGCIERLVRVRHIAHQCGGSLAQCDVIQLTLAEAALRANKADLARSLIAERVAQKPSSRLNRRLEERLA